MKTVNCTLTLVELAAGIRDGDIECEAVDTELQIDALADRDGPDCYPDTTLEFSRDGDVVASVGCWVLGQYMRGPNRRDNGVYIGQGWQWQQDESDGATTGRPRATKPRNGDTTVTFDTLGSSLQALTLTFSPDALRPDILTDIEVIQDAIDDAYGDIEVSGADDDDVYDALTRGDGVTGTISLAAGTGDYISIDVYGGIDAGRTVYTYADSGEIFDDRETMLAAAQAAFRKEIATAEFEIDFETLPRLRRRHWLRSLFRFR